MTIKINVEFRTTSNGKVQYLNFINFDYEQQFTFSLDKIIEIKERFFKKSPSIEYIDGSVYLNTNERNKKSFGYTGRLCLYKNKIVSIENHNYIMEQLKIAIKRLNTIINEVENFKSEKSKISF